MTETREQWIEREAAAARKRWRVSGEWDSVREHIRQDWRNVVAPYYPEPVADADTLEKLMDVAVNTYMEHPNIGNDPVLGRAMMAAVSAVLRAAKPRIDYEQIRVAFSECKSPKEWAEYINSRIRYRFELPQPEPLRVPVDVEGLARAMYETPDPDGKVWVWHEASSWEAETRRNEARAALACLNIEPCAKPEYDPSDVAFRDTLKKSQEIVNNWTPEQRNHNSIGYVGLQDNERAELENLRVECKRLRHEVEVERDRANDLLADRDSVVNIRDKTIKAMREENTKLRVEASEATAKAERQRKQLHSQCKTIEYSGAEIARLENEVKHVRIQRREWTDADVEDLARAIFDGLYGESRLYDAGVKAMHIAAARAALAWFDGKRGGV